VYGALAAIAVGRATGHPLYVILEALSGLTPEMGRLEARRLPGGVLLLRDDQKSSIESIYAVLDVFERMPARRRIVVLHQPTDETSPDEVAFPPLGARLARVADRLFFMGTPERFRYLAEGAGASLPGGDAWTGLDIDVLGVIGRLEATLEEGDALLVKGPGSARMDRIVLALNGRTVRCRAAYCDARFHCHDCPMAEPGWGHRRIVI
jgi:UDP-N-acetylmuramyl pentapeptide synthase